jgi:aryl-alcohol dehydrogenase-like predicted oxidoreductase
MEYRTLGNSGCAVSNLCLGTMTFGAETDEDGARAQLDRFVEAGGTLVDTADVYSRGVSEEIIGRWLAARPGDVTEPVVLATKGRFPMDAHPNGDGLSRRHLTRALDASLRRLGVDAIDLYQMHAFDPWTPLEETVRTLDGFVRAGKIRYWGLSNFTGWQLTKIVHIARGLGAVPPVTLQPQYSLIVREIEWEIVPAARDAGLGLLPWSPLGGGWLSGKYHRGNRPSGATRLGEDPNRGMEAWERRGTDRTWQIIEAVEQVAQARGVSMAEIALAWVTDRPGVTSTILGARTLEQLETNLAASDLHLTDEEVATLDKASDPGPADYPYGELGIEQRSRKLPGGR